jgi:hypothetical protein
MTERTWDITTDYIYDITEMFLSMWTSLFNNTWKHYRTVTLICDTATEPKRGVLCESALVCRLPLIRGTDDLFNNIYQYILRIIYGFNITYGRKSHLWTVLKLSTLMFFLIQLTSNTYLFIKVSGIGLQVCFIKLTYAIIYYIILFWRWYVRCVKHIKLYQFVCTSSSQSKVKLN